MLNQNNAGTQVFIDKWNAGTESYSDSLDVSSVLTGVDWGYSSWAQDGLRQINGSLTLGGYPQTPLAESLDPRANPERFQKGNRVRVLYDSATVATLYITTFPLPAHPGSPEVDIDLGCILQLLSYRQPPSTADEESDPTDSFEYSDERTAQGVIEAYLSDAGLTDITTINGTCTGSLFVQQKDGLGSWVEEAGKIAFANGHYLWQDADGVIQVSPINIKPTSPNLEIQVGGWTGQEVEFQPIQASETPVEKVICTGESVEFEDTGGSFSSVAVEYGLASAVSPYGADEKIVVAREIITETFAGASRSRDVVRYECFCAVNPFYPSNFGLVLSQITHEDWSYEGGESGRLLTYSKTVRQPVVAIAQDYSGSILVDQPGGINDMSLKQTETEFADYSYDDQDATIELSRAKKKIAVAIAPTLFLGTDEVQGYGPFNLVPAGGTIEKWIGDHDAGLWRYKKTEYGPLAENAKSQQTVSAAQLATGLVRRTIETSNNGSTQPPSAERREPTKIERREPIEGDAEFLLPADSPFQERERYYDIPYGNTISKLNDRAEELGTLLIGRSLGVSFSLPLTSINPASISTPHQRIDFTTPDGAIQSFVVDNLSWAIDGTTAVCSGDGIYLGSVADPAKPGQIRKPYREGVKAQAAIVACSQVVTNQPDLLDQVAQSQIVAQSQVIAELFEGVAQSQIVAQSQVVAYGLVVVTGTKSPVGESGMTQVVSVSEDDAAQTLTLPFSFDFYGVATTQIHPCSNMFVALESQVTDYQNHSLTTPVPAQRCIHLGSGDNSWQRVYTYTDPDGLFYRVRIEGSETTSGTPGSPTIVAEMTFFAPQPNAQFIEVVFGAHGRPSGVFGIVNGLSSGSNLNTNGGTITPDQSYVFQSDQDGNGWTITANRYIEIV